MTTAAAVISISEKSISATQPSIKMLTRIWTKKQTQTVIKAIRAQKLKVIKSESGFYECHAYRYGGTGERELVFSAMPGIRGYLVRHHVDLFSAVEVSAAAK